MKHIGRRDVIGWHVAHNLAVLVVQELLVVQAVLDYAISDLNRSLKERWCSLDGAIAVA